VTSATLTRTDHNLGGGPLATRPGYDPSS
jgi:hypothetical protein